MLNKPIKIKAAETQQEENQLDKLLWEVLWKPFDLPCDVRTEFKLPGKELELVALDNCKIIGALVANWIDENELEIRHLAVYPAYQNKSVGTSLVTALFNFIKENKPVKIQVHARNASQKFFEKMGFLESGQNWIDHPNFKKYGVRFRSLEKYL